MARGYWVASIDMNDRLGYKAYMAEAAKAFSRYAARILTCGEATEAAGDKTRSPVVVIEFPDYAAAIECYRSPEYAKAKALGLGNATADVVILDGYAGPQPSGLSSEDAPWPFRRR